MMKVITQNVFMMVETAVDHASIQTTVQTAFALMMLLAMECPMPLWEMDSAMMKLITQNVTLTVETAVDHASILTIAQIALALEMLLTMEFQMR